MCEKWLTTCFGNELKVMPHIHNCKHGGDNLSFKTTHIMPFLIQGIMFLIAFESELLLKDTVGY